MAHRSPLTRLRVPICGTLFVLLMLLLGTAAAEDLLPAPNAVWPEQSGAVVQTDKKLEVDASNASEG